MEYGQVISRSFAIVWRHKYLWLLAILGGADVGGGGYSGNYGGNYNYTYNGSSSASFNNFWQQFGNWVQANLGLLIAVGVALLVIGFIWFLLSCVTTGSLIRAAAEHDADRPFGLGMAWRTGLQTFWKVLVLKLIEHVLGLLVLAGIIVLVVLAVQAAIAGNGGVVATIVILGLLGLLALIPIAIVVGIGLILAMRAIVLEGRGPLSAIGRGFQLFGRRLGRTLLVWVIQLAVGIAAGIALGVVLLVVAAPFGAAIVGMVAGGASVGATMAVAIPLGALLAVASIVLGGLVGAYFSTYWTLAFRRLDLDPMVAAPAGPPPAYPPQPAT